MGGAAHLGHYLMERERENRTLSVCGLAGVKQQDLHATKRDSRPGQGWDRDPGLEAAGKQLLFWRYTHRMGLAYGRVCLCLSMAGFLRGA